MPKKTRRQRRRAQAARAPAAPATQTRDEASATAIRPAVVARATAATKVDLAQEYDYVFADLRKIAVIAVAMFALLFALAFVLK